MRIRSIFVAVLVSGFLALALESTLAKGQRVMTVDSLSSAQTNKAHESKQENEVPFACSLTALSAAERARHKELSGELHAAVTETRELPNGYAFRLSGERRSLALAAEWVSLERLCCPFFTFQIEAGSATQPIWLRLTGREGVKLFMQSEFGIK